MLKQTNVLRVAVLALLLLVVCEPFVCNTACFAPAPRITYAATHHAGTPTAAAVPHSASADQQPPASTDPASKATCALGHAHTAIVVALGILVAFVAVQSSLAFPHVALRHQPQPPLRRPPIATLVA